MKNQFNKDHLVSVKKSYFNILALFLGENEIESRFLRCLLKWGFQLSLTPEDLRTANIDISSLTFMNPGDKIEKLEAIYHLVYMIYLDEVVEDIELEVAIIYAERLGFKSTVVSDLFKSIATQVYDQTKPRDVHNEVLEFLKLNDVD